MKMKKILYVILPALAISGCSFTKDINVISTPRNKTKLELELPIQLDLHTFKWDAITPKNIDEKFNSSDKPVFICTSPNGYVMMSKNTEKLQGYIIELQAIINQYKAYYETQTK